MSQLKMTEMLQRK